MHFSHNHQGVAGLVQLRSQALVRQPQPQRIDAAFNALNRAFAPVRGRVVCQMAEGSKYSSAQHHDRLCEARQLACAYPDTNNTVARNGSLVCAQEERI